MLHFINKMIPAGQETRLGMGQAPAFCLTCNHLRLNLHETATSVQMCLLPGTTPSQSMQQTPVWQQPVRLGLPASGTAPAGTPDAPHGWPVLPRQGRASLPDCVRLPGAVSTLGLALWSLRQKIGSLRALWHRFGSRASSTAARIRMQAGALFGTIHLDSLELVFFVRHFHDWF